MPPTPTDREHALLDTRWRAAHTGQHLRDRLIAHRRFIRAHGEDMPEVPGWRRAVRSEPSS
jgi:xylulose-5-phosphate/fructose-6-phosphate phosphoketolase